LLQFFTKSKSFAQSFFERAEMFIFIQCEWDSLASVEKRPRIRIWALEIWSGCPELERLKGESREDKETVSEIIQLKTSLKWNAQNSCSMVLS
jgi:hypothetical protein